MTQPSYKPSYSKCSVCGLVDIVTINTGGRAPKIERRAMSREEEVALTLMEQLQEHVCTECEGEKKRLEKERIEREKYERVAAACLRVPVSRLPRKAPRG